MDEAGFETAHIVGNSLGGYLALQLAARGRARSVVALAPGRRLGRGRRVLPGDARLLPGAAGAGAGGRAARGRDRCSRRRAAGRATLFTTTNFEHIPAELLAHQIARRRGLRGRRAR